MIYRFLRPVTIMTREIVTRSPRLRPAEVQWKRHSYRLIGKPRGTSEIDQVRSLTNLIVHSHKMTRSPSPPPTRAADLTTATSLQTKHHPHQPAPSLCQVRLRMETWPSPGSLRNWTYRVSRPLEIHDRSQFSLCSFLQATLVHFKVSAISKPLSHRFHSEYHACCTR